MSKKEASNLKSLIKGEIERLNYIYRTLESAFPQELESAYSTLSFKNM